MPAARGRFVAALTVTIAVAIYYLTPIVFAAIGLGALADLAEYVLIPLLVVLAVITLLARIAVSAPPPPPPKGRSPVLWMLAGCGGCLGLVVIVILAVGGSAFFLSRPVGAGSTDLTAWSFLRVRWREAAYALLELTGTVAQVLAPILLPLLVIGLVLRMVFLMKPSGATQPEITARGLWVRQALSATMTALLWPLSAFYFGFYFWFFVLILFSVFPAVQVGCYVASWVCWRNRSSRAALFWTRAAFFVVVAYGATCVLLSVSEGRNAESDPQRHLAEFDNRVVGALFMFDGEYRKRMTVLDIIHGDNKARKLDIIRGASIEELNRVNRHIFCGTPLLVALVGGDARNFATLRGDSESIPLIMDRGGRLRPEEKPVVRQFLFQARPGRLPIVGYEPQVRSDLPEEQRDQVMRRARQYSGRALQYSEGVEIPDPCQAIRDAISDAETQSALYQAQRTTARPGHDLTWRTLKSKELSACWSAFLGESAVGSAPEATSLVGQWVLDDNDRNSQDCYAWNQCAVIQRSGSEIVARFFEGWCDEREGQGFSTTMSGSLRSEGTATVSQDLSWKSQTTRLARDDGGLRVEDHTLFKHGAEKGRARSPDQRLTCYYRRPPWISIGSMRTLRSACSGGSPSPPPTTTVPPQPDAMSLSSITPVQTTVLIPGDPVSISATVAYTLKSAASGRVTLTIEDETGRILQGAATPSVTIQRGSASATVSDRVNLPARGMSRVVNVVLELLPEGASTPTARQTVSYFVR